MSTKYSLEAKSRHRPGYLGHPGMPKPLDEIKADVYRLLQNALEKRADHDRVIFIDLNIPENYLTPHTDGFTRVAEQVSRLEDTQGTKPYPRAFVFFTNQPHHYVGNDPLGAIRSHLLTTINIPVSEQEVKTLPIRHPAIFALRESLCNQMPVEFV